WNSAPFEECNGHWDTMLEFSPAGRESENTKSCISASWEEGCETHNAVVDNAYFEKPSYVVYSSSRTPTFNPVDSQCKNNGISGECKG
ncbi:hypothetical protein H0H93_013965, partial [Arthromyces matolae]